jgi:excisionase family DNA binding protein
MPSNLKFPGEIGGHCESLCPHLDCISLRQIATSLCRICQERIGYERNYYAESNSFVHEACLREELVKKTALQESGKPTFLEVPEVASLLRTTPQTIQQWVSQNRIPFRKANGKVLFLLDEILNWTIPGKAKKESKQPRLKAVQ